MLAFADNIETMCKYSAQEKDIRFSIACRCKGAESIISDKMRLQQIMMNLLSNSIKFTPAGGCVSCIIELISINNGNAMYQFIVEDTGVGMSQEFLQHIYESFTQEKNDITSQYAGTGLGMSIVKSLVDLMKGSIHIDSKKNEGTHTAIMLEFPLGDDAEVRSADSADPDLHNTHVLLCEDHPLNAEISIRLLQKAGCTADWAHDGKEGVEKFSTSKPGTYQAILMDIRMPVMDGIEASKTIRSMIRSDAGSIPIIAMTANTLDDDIQSCTRAGMNAHLSKPVDPHELYQTLRRCIDSIKSQT